MTPTISRIQVFDTTLRDGEQAPGFSMTAAEKLRLAQQLDRLGVDIIEAGFPISSDGDFEAVRAIAGAVRRPIIAGLARAIPADIDRAWAALSQARASTHPRLPRDIGHPSRTQAAHHARAVSRADRHLRRPRARLLRRRRVLGRGCDAQRPGRFCATSPRLPSTPGRPPSTCLTPSATRCRTASPGCLPRSARAIRRQAVMSAHCHNDLGLAVANSLAAIQAGARQVECTINGIGERAGNASLEEIVMALQVRADALPHRTVHQHAGPRAGQQHAVVDRRRVGSAQQGDRRRQRVRTRSRHSPGRHAQARAHLRNHAAGIGRRRRHAPRARQALRDCAASTRAAAPWDIGFASRSSNVSTFASRRSPIAPRRSTTTSWPPSFGRNWPRPWLWAPHRPPVAETWHVTENCAVAGRRHRS